MQKDYTFYRKKAGLDFDKFIELHPEKDGEALFQTFMKRYDCYYTQRDLLIKKFTQKLVDEKDETKFSRIEAEKMYAIAQLEQVFIDVMRVLFGLSPDDENAKFGNTIATRYIDFVSNNICLDKFGFYLGADGLYRIGAFYEDDYIPISVMKEYYSLGDKVYKDDSNIPEGDIHLIIEGKEIELPEQDPNDPIPIHLKVIEKILELEKSEKEKEVSEPIKEEK